ncbi:hypothetical protein [Geosporobacter ferrireducens]|uniref:Uncharacterized protein n=1 Tax=Geosporobacter ferrireducens TaxID=1424294 RepID=A0A1D8GBQ3_9FIRM|nr:hypothetical protein [Geosporobacter ferrireducens]AOT68335.1 hypothetical protein Gferi_01245 [Geosporobacter ferrireducens]
MAQEKAVIITSIIIGAAVFSNIISHEIKKYLRYVLLAFILFILLTRFGEILLLMDAVATITWPTFKEWVITGSQKLVKLLYLITH